MELSPRELAQQDRYKLLIGGIVPRPIAFVSTIAPRQAGSQAGAHNLAPFSFFAGVGSEPMSLLFCPANKPDGSEKDSLRNARPCSEGGTGEFVVNIACEPYERRVAGAAEPLDYGDSEFSLVGLTPAPSRVVAPPRVAESPICFECRTRQVIRLAPGVPGGGNIVIGEVVHVHVADDIINDRFHIDPERLRAIGRMGGIGYCRTAAPSHRFQMPMGREALQ
ncbi:MAG: flavin reductase family protein [Phycisphaerales bacterium]